MLGVVIVLGVEAFFEGVVHGVDGGLAGFVAGHGVEILFLYEEEDEKEGNKDCHDDDLENCEAGFFVHVIIVA